MEGKRDIAYRETLEEAGVVADGVVAGALEAGLLAEVTAELPGTVLEAAEDTGAELEPAPVDDAPAELVAFKQLLSARYVIKQNRAQSVKLPWSHVRK